MKVYPINLDTEEIDEPKMVRVDVDETVGELKQEIASLFDTDPISLQVRQKQMKRIIVMTGCRS